MGPTNFCSSSCKRLRIGSRRSESETSASHGLREPCVIDEKPDNGEQRSLEAVARVIRGLLFVIGLLLGLAFAVACYAEMLGVVQFG
jgi:hypothetical protein